MAEPSTYTYKAVGSADRRGVQAEDVSDIISNIAPSETPLLSACKTKTSRGTIHEWIEDDLGSIPVATNKAVEGADAATTDLNTGTRYSNNTQISQKAYGVSGTFEASDNYGFDSAIAYAGAKAARMLKNEVDAVISGYYRQAKAGSGASDPDTGATTADIDSWLTQGDWASDGSASAGTGTNNSTDGTDRAFTQTLLDNAVEAAWESGGRPSLIVTGPHNRKAFSTFDGMGNGAGANNIMRNDRASKTIVGTADVYMSNFGDLSIVTSRHIYKQNSLDADAWLIDPEHIAMAYLRPWQESDLAKTGDSVNRQMLVEYALEVTNRKAHAHVADLGAE